VAGKYGKSTQQSTQRHHQANEGKSNLEAEWVQVLGALHSLRFKKDLGAEKSQEMHLLSNGEKAKWIKDYVERDTAGARMRVEDAETTIRQEQEDTDTAENSELTTKEPEKWFNKRIVTIGDSLSNIASSNDEEVWEDADVKETEQGQRSEDDEPGCWLGKINQIVLQRMEMFQQEQMKLDELSQPGWENSGNYFNERDKRYGTSKLRVPAAVQPPTDDDKVAPALATFEELMKCVDIVPGISQMPQGTSRPGSSHIRLGSEKSQSNMSILCLVPAAEPDSSPIQNVKPVELVSFVCSI
jgi:hypothetical protein